MRALIGDCGGTFSRFALVENDAITPIGRFRNAEFTSLAALIKSLRIKADILALAIAGPDNRVEITFTNCHFTANAAELQALGFDKVLLMNDFVPLSLSLAAPEKLDLTAINAHVKLGNRLIIGPGTGLGVGALISVGDKFMPIATETGHIDFSTPLRIEGHICAETILSGVGFTKIYKAMGGSSLTPENLVAQLPHDLLAQEAARVFFDHLARLAGDLALIFLPHGGIFITGGMADRLINYLEPTRFMAHFTRKPPYENLLRTMPIMHIKTPDPAFLGLKALVTSSNKFVY
jgi:glucokinase